MNLKDILELEEFKDTLIAHTLRWWITERLGRKIEDVLWWNVKEYPPIIGDTGYIELSAHFKDGTPFVQIFPEKELEEKTKHQAARDIIREAAAIAKNTPGMLVLNLRDGGWAICLDDGDYSVEAKTAEELLAEVKVAKAYYEASQKAKKGHQATREMIREGMEKSKKDDGEVIRVDGLDQETKELLLHFIESLTIKDASDILSKEYPCSVWDELHFIREKLRKSLAQPRRRP
jgi:hypothetical protein